MTVRMKIKLWPVCLPYAVCFLQLLKKQSGSFCKHSSAARRAGLRFLACLVLSLSLLLFLLSYGLLTFGYLSTSPPSNPAWENAHNESGLLFLLSLWLRNKAAHLNNAHCFLTLSSLFVSFILLSPPPLSPVTSSLLSPSHLLSKVSSYFVFTELLIMQVRGSISLLEREFYI